MSTPTPEQIAAVLGCTVEQVRALCAKNAAQLGGMASKAKATGKKVNGYTASELSAHARTMGAKGGKTKGATKARDPEKMRAAALVRWAKKAH